MPITLPHTLPQGKAGKKALQALYNAIAGGLVYDIPQTEIVALECDRTWFRGFITGLEEGKPFTRWDFNPSHGETAIRGWRENVGMWSMQVVQHSTGVYEVDFDMFNPDWGVLPLIGHGIECLWPGKTDPFKVAKGLRKRGWKVLSAE